MYKILAKLPFETNTVHYLPSCHSTNEVAQDLLQSDVGEGTLVITDDQTSGKGQRGNVWLSKPGQNLTFSLILRPRFLKPNEQFYITVAISLALKEMLEEYLPGEVKIKWPNDIYYGARKIAGLLIENILRGSSFESCIVGIGLNVNQLEFPDELRASSMVLESGKEYELNEILNNILSRIGVFYVQIKGKGKVLLNHKYHEALLGIGEERKFIANSRTFMGVIEGTDAFGQLLIREKDELMVFQHKEVQMLF